MRPWLSAGERAAVPVLVALPHPPATGLGKVREFGWAATLVKRHGCGCARFAASVPGGNQT